MIKRKQRNNQQLNRQPFWQADKPYMKRQDITDSRFRTLGYSMAFSAGAINAGGFFAVSSYTSHVTGTLSRVSDAILHGEWVMAFTAIMSVVMFVLGAAHASWIILWAKRRRFSRQLCAFYVGRSILFIIFWIFWLCVIGVGLADGVSDYFYFFVLLWECITRPWQFFQAARFVLRT